jgi:putative inorganic carbon (HCO3(-)) transporter
VTADLARVAGPLGCAGLALLLVAPRRWQRLAALGLWGLGLFLLAVYLAPSGHTAALAGAAVLGVAATGAGAALLLRWPWLLALATLACVPARIPVTIEGDESNLLLPLYGIVGAAALALAWELLRGDERARELGTAAWPLALFVAWTGLSLTWTGDLRQGSIGLAAFYLPFGVLALCLARLPWSRRWLTALYGELVLMALVFAAVGVYQWVTRDVFWNPKVIVGNAYAPFFRVNSVFWDPSIYGRFLVVAIVVSLVLVLHGATQRVALAAGTVIVLAWAGLVFSFSQSSFAALMAAVIVAAAFAWRWRAVAVAAIAAAALVLVGISAPSVRSAGLNHATSGRSKLVSQGLRIALHHPIAGVGVGDFKKAYAARTGLRGKEPKRAASHNTPVTVAAETGIVGVLLLGWLAVAAGFVAFRVVPRTFAGRASLAAGLSLGAIAMHSLFYNALFEDPTAWALLGLAVLCAAQVQRERRPA